MCMNCSIYQTFIVLSGKPLMSDMKIVILNFFCLLLLYMFVLCAYFESILFPYLLACYLYLSSGALLCPCVVPNKK